MNQTTIPLIFGKPIDGSRGETTEKGASFSRFVLPFSYKIEETKNNKAGTSKQENKSEPELFYKVNPLQNLSFLKRKKYFSWETSLTLYKRALWLDMSDGWQKTSWGKEEIDVTIRGRKLKVGMLPPRIILFEAGKEPTISKLAKTPKKNRNVLQSGFLLVDLYFPSQPETPGLDDLLTLNEYFRFFALPYNKHAKIFQKILGEVPVNYQYDQESDKVKKCQENLRKYFERWANLLKLPILSDNKFYSLFPEEWSTNAKKLSYEKPGNKESVNTENNWQIYADNRCFVWTAALIKGGGNTLQKMFEPDKKKLIAKDYGHWIKLLNVDAPYHNSSSARTHASVNEFERNWADERTYKRWEEDGTWYGSCYHSGAALGDSNYIFPHYSSYYFDSVLLLFYIRISLFAFSKELAKVFNDNDSNSKQLRKELSKIRKQFSRFTVLYQFPLLSNQQQHIEMYELARKHFDIDDFFNEVQQEINSIHDFFESEESTELSSAANKLAKFGIPIAAGGLLAGLFSMGDLNLVSAVTKSGYVANWDIIFQIIFVLLIVGIAFKHMDKLTRFWDDKLLSKKKGDRKKMTFFLRVEGMNLGNFVMDTSDLATIRGGSLLLLDAMDKVEETIKEMLPKPNFDAQLAEKTTQINKIKKEINSLRGEEKKQKKEELAACRASKNELKRKQKASKNPEPTITKGASWGLFELNDINHDTAKKIKEKIVDFFNSDSNYKHATFMVDFYQKSESDSYQNARDKTQTMNRWQQLQAPTLAITKEGKTVCAIDQLRPADTEINYKQEKAMASASVKVRRDYGIKEKEKAEFYKKRGMLAECTDLRFTHDFEELSKKPPQYAKHLEGKIAFIYLDGNDFGKMQKSCQTPDEQRNFDQQTRKGREKVLQTIIEEAKEKDDWLINDKLRLETLLWGGDEIVWVVPAWRGWWMLMRFYELAQEHIRLKEKDGETKELFHGSALIFCHHNAPIQRIDSLSRSLADDFAKQEKYKKSNKVAYQILESFDHIGGNLADFRKQTIKGLDDNIDNLLIDANNMQEISNIIKKLKEHDFPRRKLYQIVQALKSGDNTEADELHEKIIGTNKKEQTIYKGELDRIKNIFKDDSAPKKATDIFWLHLLELWDFAGIDDTKPKSKGA